LVAKRHAIAITACVSLMWVVTAVDPAFGETRGLASWYGRESGRFTANGERFNPDGISCAHRTLPFGTRVKVTDLSTDRSVVCRISDRGPALRTHRIIDLSYGAAKALGIVQRGTAEVRIDVVK